MRAEGASLSATLLVVQSGAGAWCVDGQSVIEVARATEWSGTPPLEVADLLDLGPGHDDASDARVVLLRAGSETVPLMARGKLSLRQTTFNELLPVPAAFKATSSLVSQVAVVDGVPALFVLSPARLLEVAQCSRP